MGAFVEYTELNFMYTKNIPNTTLRIKNMQSETALWQNMWDYVNQD